MPRTPAPLRTIGVLLRALLGLVLLVALVAGAPYVLLAVGHQPTELSGGVDLLLEQDDGTLFLVVLTCLGWASWALFAFSVLVELVAVLRRRSAPRIRGLGSVQSLASFLIGGIVLLAPTAASAATSAPAVAVTAVHTTEDSPIGSSPATTAVSSPDEADWPQHTVGSASELPWDLAEEYLGDGKRWKDIAALNPGIPQLAAGDQFLPEGSVIKLPADARRSQMSAASAREAEAAEGDDREYIVQPGDYLSEIAKKQLGDADQWPVVFEENKGEQQPHGQRFTDPDVIYPGQSITLPSTPDAGAGPAAKAPSASETNGVGQDDEPRDQEAMLPPADQDEKPSHEAAEPSSTPEDAASSAPEESAHGSVPAPAGSAATDPGSAAPSADNARPSQTPSSTGSAEAAPSTENESGSVSQVGVLGLAATGVLAAGFLSVLGYRRIMQLRERRRGRRIPLPQDGAARAEHALRVAEAMTDTAMLDAVLRTAAVHLTEAGRELPRLAAAVVGERDIVLHLGDPAAPVPPFTATPDSLQRWTCPTATKDLLPETETNDVDAPYPALVSLGWDPDGRLVLVDLEHIGHLHLTGPARDRVLRTLALELATSEFTHHADVGLVGEEAAPGLEEELPERVTLHQSPGQGLAALRARHSEQQRALSLLDADTMRHARTGVDTAAAWTPYLLLLADGFEDADEDVLDQLLETVADEPRTATVLITAGEASPGLPESSWTLHAEPEAGPIRLPVAGEELDCTVQALSDEDFAYALEILATSREDDVPAPEPEAPALETQTAAPPADDDGAGEPVAADAAFRTVPADAGSGPGQVPNLMSQFAVFDDGDVPKSENPTGPAESSPQPPSEAKPDGAVPQVVTQTSEAVRRPMPAHQSPTKTISIRLPDSDDTPALPDPAAGLELPSQSQSSPSPTDPVVRVLGAVELTGARGTTERKREGRSIELAAWLVLHPGSDRHLLDEAMWPAGGTTRKYRNATVSRLRTWLGEDDDGNAYFPAISSTPDARYTLSPAVGCDWHQFQELVRTGKQTSGPYADQALRDALSLVRGRPFASSDRSRYRWAEHLALVMIMEIVDTADLLAERCLAARDPRGALWAATRGLEVAPEIESLYRILFRAYAAIGDYDALERAAQKLQTFNEENDIETEEDTLAVLNGLMARV
ncbi:LysM peptidoglycan-binding domain-containing protein [Streptomyces sp. Ju416(a)]|uniref:LysM peptidoglycan-binding domain-containing protein n=1 Tax=Streptomyces sp. Ju416(a) TaxID=3446591 RepID=UPI00403D651F